MHRRELCAKAHASSLQMGELRWVVKNSVPSCAEFRWGAKKLLSRCNIHREWKKAGRNFLTLKELVEGAREAIHTLVMGTKEEFGKADVELLKISNCLGDRTEEMGTTTAFDMLMMLGEDSERFTPLERYVHEHSAKWEMTLMQKIAAQVKVGGGDTSDVWKNKFLIELKVEIEPVFRLYTKLSSSFATPADYLEKELTKIKTDIATIKSTVATLKSAGGLGPNLSRIGNQGLGGGTEAGFGSLLLKYNTLLL
jgi:hypothetical protein